MCRDSLNKILWEHFSICLSIPGQTSHTQWEYWQNSAKNQHFERRTAQRGIKFSGDDLNLSGYSDANWAGDLDSRRSTTGYVIYAAGGPIAWQSKL